MKKRYNYQEFKNDPRTLSSDKKYPRYMIVLFNCIENENTAPEEIFAEIDKAYSTGKHRSPSYIKKHKLFSIDLLNRFDF